MKRRMPKVMTAILLIVAMLSTVAPMTATAASATGTGASGGSITATPVDTGVKVSWSAYSGAQGYCLYRTQGDSTERVWAPTLTTVTELVDIGVDANTEYTYLYSPVLDDGEPLDEYFGEVTIRTKAEILGGGVTELAAEGITKNAVLMKVDDPFMSVNGAKQEIDPGRGTAPIVVNNRTLVPIRAIIEAMDGIVGWDDATQKITLDANGHHVEMWLDKPDLIVDGASSIMDIAPTSINDRTMVPVRFAAENVGCVVDWIDATSEIVVVFYKGGTPSFIKTGTTTVTPAPDPTPGPGPSVAPSPQPTPNATATVTGSGPELKNNYSKAELSGIVADLAEIVQSEPTGGRKITSAELYDMLDPYYKAYGDGNTWHSKSSYGYYSLSGGKWVVSECEINETWYRDNDSKSETLSLASSYAQDDVGKIRCSISNEDASYYYYYSWVKGATEGDFMKYAKTPSGGSSGSSNEPIITLYADATVNGLDCFVYSYENVYDGTTYKSYYWYSKSKGYDILYQSFDHPGEVLSSYTYVEDMLNKDNSFFDETKQGVTKWNEWD